MRAGILTIGDELINGFTVDTNAVWLSQALLSRGVSVAIKASVGDETGAIEAILDQWDGEYDWVITTGGLGPSHDDITKS
ncbi:MAG: competence/damage-inducible protein A, partial [Candidatus Marinimicrobia bacterium]|nr:competence/damage-inducible protein A [Candidatus Neomarinimicrobiota bacterium]